MITDFIEDLTSKEELFEQMNTMNSFGLRVTGTKGQRDFCAYLKQEIAKLGLETTSREYRFDKWEASEASLTVDGKDFHISSVFPYSGLTGSEGITAPLVKVHNTPIGFMHGNGAIGVLRVGDLKGITSKIAFDMRSAYPADLTIDRFYKGPVATSFVKTLLTFWSIQFSGLKGLICIWEGISDEMAEGQWLNFILGYLKVPAIWVNQSVGEEVLKLAGSHKPATLKVIGSIEKAAKTESFYSIIKGTEDNGEAIIINTHTDGCNFVEENGGIGMLSLMRYFSKHPTKRTLIFVFVTGHFRLPNFRTGFDQATSRWLADNKNVWKHQNGGYKVVAGCSIEHLGCTEWKDVDSKYTMTNEVDKEIVYTGNKQMDKIYYEACDGRSLIRTITQRGHNLMHFGEGQPLFNKGIPEIALVTAPDYLCSVDTSGNSHMDKFNLNLMYEQISTFGRCIQLIDDKSQRVIGRAEPYSFGLGRLKKAAEGQKIVNF